MNTTTISQQGEAEKGPATSELRLKLALAVGMPAKGAVPILVARALGAPVEVQALTGVAAVLGAWKSVFSTLTNPQMKDERTLYFCQLSQ
jgi:hypothetical protein